MSISPELSRRLGKIDPLRTMTFTEWNKLLLEVSKYESYEQLPEEIRVMISAAEQGLSTKLVQTKQITQEDLERYTQELSQVVRSQLNTQVNEAIRNLQAAIESKAYGDSDEEEDERFALEMMAVLLPLVYLYGRSEQAKGLAMLIQAGLPPSGVSPFTLTDSQMDAYRVYLMKVGTYFNEQTAQKIRDVLAVGIESGQTRAQIEAGLRELISDDYRVSRIAISEVNRAEGHASVDAMMQIQEQTGHHIVKVWTHSGSDSPCEFCRALIGTEVDVNTTFVPVGGVVMGVEGGELKNTFVSMETCDAHPFCHCLATYQVVPENSISRQAHVKEIGELKKQIGTQEDQLKELDGRTKEAKALKKQLDDALDYAKQLEGIIDGSQ